jgi:hypothetical protein
MRRVWHVARMRQMINLIRPVGKRERKMPFSIVFK